jgi:CheY-specific phosphatase CheX
MIDTARFTEHLAASACAVLETMCGMKPSPDPDLTDEQREHLACVQVCFAGPFTGSLVMAAEDDAAQLFAPAFLGLGSEEQSPEMVAAVLAEMANMICGATVSRLKPSGLFSLSSPAPLAPLPDPEEGAVELDMDCGCGALIVQLRVE